MRDMKVAVLIDGIHGAEIVNGLARLVELRDSELLLAYVEGPLARAGLDLVTHRPGSRPLPPHRERELREAEESAGGAAIEEAEAAARRHGARTEAVRLSGEPGRELCALAEQRRSDLVVVRAGGPDTPAIGPASLGPAARFIADHCRAPVLLLRAR